MNGPYIQGSLDQIEIQLNLYNMFFVLKVHYIMQMWKSANIFMLVLI